MSSSSVPAPVGTSPPSAPPSSASVAVIEKKYWGGVCLNVGCIPSKALLRNAELAHILTHEKDKFGITGDASMDFEPTHARSRKVSDAIVKGVHFLMKKNKITEIDGWGTFIDAKTIEVEGRRRQHQRGHRRQRHHRHRRDHPARSPAPSSPSASSPTRSRSSTDELPGSIVIAGSGAIGVEFAYVMKNFGVDVTIVEFLDRMVPTEDAEVSKELAQALQEARREGDARRTKVESIDDSGDKVKVTVSPADGGEQKVIETDKVLQAIGFAPRVEGYGLENDRRRDHRPRRDRRRRARPHQRRRRLRDRRLSPAS